MKLIRVGETQIVCSPLLLAAVPLAVVFGRETALIVAFVSLSVHEAAHAMMASRMGCRVDSIEVQPFGFIARLECAEAPAGDLAAIYAAGPAASLCMAAVSALTERVFPACAAWRLGFTEFNLLIAAVNMLPAIPLDGGRLILAAFSGRGRRTALRVLRCGGLAAGSAFLGISAWMFFCGAVNPTFALMGAFLIVSAMRERPDMPALTKPKRICPRRAVAVREMAFSAETSLSSALAALSPGAYSVVSVIDADMRRIGVLDETRLLEAAKVLGASAELAEAVALYG